MSNNLPLSSQAKKQPIILFTSHGHPTDVLTGLQLGVTDYIPKDAFAQATLLNTIRYLNKGGSS